MKLSQFHFDLELKRIPLQPSKSRESCRLMVVHKDTGKIEHKMFADILDIFSDKDVFVVNNTKVFPARLFGRKEKTGAKIEVFLLRELNERGKLWDVLVEPARKIRVNNKLLFGENDELAAEVIDNAVSRGRIIKFLSDMDNDEFKKQLYALGQTPIPKYFKRLPTAEDDERYQTVYAKNFGSVAAHAAGLHFSKRLVKQLEVKGIQFAEVTLHIGLGTYRQIGVEDLSKHKMDAEFYDIDEYACKLVNTAKENNRKVCVVGSTTMRALESSITTTGMLKPSTGWTSLFVHPPFDFSLANAMITNFHLPKTSLQVMAASFAGFELAMEAYEVAVKEKYNFYTYGDAMLII